MNWTVIIPLKAAHLRKQRLAGTLTQPQRVNLTEEWLRHVCRAIRPLARVMLLSPCAGGPVDGWMEDRGRGLNIELASARAILTPGPVAVILADLPFLTSLDVQELFDAAALTGCAIAPDHHGMGTNAIAIADDREFRFHFGAGSLALHVADSGAGCAIVNTPGLARDIDTPTDLSRWHRASGAPASR